MYLFTFFCIHFCVLIVFILLHLVDASFHPKRLTLNTCFHDWEGRAQGGLGVGCGQWGSNPEPSPPVPHTILPFYPFY